MGVDPRARSRQLVASPHDQRTVVRTGPEAGERVGEDGIAGRGGQSGDGVGG